MEGFASFIRYCDLRKSCKYCIYNIFLYLIGREGRNAVYVSRKIKLIIEI